MTGMRDYWRGVVESWREWWINTPLASHVAVMKRRGRDRRLNQWRDAWRAQHPDATPGTIVPLMPEGWRPGQSTKFEDYARRWYETGGQM